MFYGFLCVKLGHSILSSLRVRDNRVCNWNKTTGATSGAGTAYPSGAPVCIPTPVLVEFVLLDL